MQPEDKNTKPDFDFLKDQPPQQKKSLLSGLGKPVRILVALLVVLVLVIVAAAFLNRGGGNSQQVLDLMAQSQEIVRVSQLSDLQFQDSNTKALAATAATALQSQQTEIGDYLGRVGVNYGENELAARTNQDTDARLQTAAQNNNLDTTYTDYLKDSLDSYQASLTEVFRATESPTLLGILQSAHDSVTTLLASPQFKP